MWCLARLGCRNTLKFHGPSRKCIISKVIGKLVCCSLGKKRQNEEKLFKVGEDFSLSSRAFLQPVLLTVDCWLLYGLHADWSGQRNKLRLSWAAASAQEGSFCCATQMSSNSRALSHTLLRKKVWPHLKSARIEKLFLADPSKTSLTALLKSIPRRVFQW